MERGSRHIGLPALPGGREAPPAGARALGAPDDILAALDRLPAETTHETVVQIWDALDRTV